MTVPLPAEILKNIFNLLDKKDLNNCRSTCRHWKLAAEEKLREIVRMLDFTSAGLGRLEHMIKNSSDVADRVKHIDIDWVYITKAPSTSESSYFHNVIKTLDCIFRYCRNIETIAGMSGNLDEGIWSKILDAVNEGYLQKLQSLPKVPNDLSYIDRYYTPIAWGLRFSLKRRNLRIDSSEYQSMLKGNPSDVWLYDFISLEELTVYFGETLLTFDNCNHLIDMCNNHSSLQSLCLIQSVYKSLRFYHSDEEQDITPCTNIKQLTVSPSDFLDQKPFMLYLTHKFPTLTKLCMDWPCPSDSFRRLELFNLLADYISHIDQVQFFYYTDDIYKPDQFLVYLLKRYNMTVGMVEACDVPEDCHQPWILVDRIKSHPGSYKVSDVRNFSEDNIEWFKQITLYLNQYTNIQ